MKKVFTASLLLLIFCACKKNTNNPVGPVGLLKSYLVKITTPGAGASTYATTILSYDSLGRVTQIATVSIDSTSTPVYIDHSALTFSYAGPTTYPSNYIDNESGFLSNHMLRYDNQNRYTLDSIISITPTYTGTTGGYTAYSKYTSYPGNQGISLYSDLYTHTIYEIDSVTYTNQNPTLINVTSIPGGAKAVSTISFGASLNPLYTLNLPFEPLSEFTGKNLPASEILKQYQPGGVLFETDNIAYQYTFNGSGQLSKTVISELGIPVMTITYEYQ